MPKRTTPLDDVEAVSMLRDRWQREHRTMSREFVRDPGSGENEDEIELSSLSMALSTTACTGRVLDLLGSWWAA